MTAPAFASWLNGMTVIENQRCWHAEWQGYSSCLLYTSDAADERSSVDLGGRRIIKKKNSIDVSRGGSYKNGTTEQVSNNGASNK